ncbi:MAG: FkbM family methyltransferase [Marivirga sp.]|jgi:FkbM family methyltransferase
MSRQIIKLLKFIKLLVRREGIFQGIWNYLLITSKDSGLKKIRLKGYRNDIYLRPRTSDKYLVESILYREEYDVSLRGLTPLNIVDIGANAGFTSVYFSNKFRDARIHSFEPELANFELLKKNVEHCSNVLASKEAVWGYKTKLSPISGSDDSWSFSLEEGSSIENGFEAIGLVDILERIDGFIDILKIDIEGAEKNLFIPSQSEWLHKVKIIVIELHDRKLKGCSEALYKSLVMNEISFTQKNYGYNTVIYNESFFD